MVKSPSGSKKSHAPKQNKAAPLLLVMSLGLLGYIGYDFAQDRGLLNPIVSSVQKAVQETDFAQSVTSQEKKAAVDLVFDALTAAQRKDRNITPQDTLEQITSNSSDPNFDKGALDRTFAPGMDEAEVQYAETIFVTLADQLAPKGVLRKHDEGVSTSGLIYKSRSGSLHVPLGFFTDLPSPPMTVEVIKVDGRYYIDPYSIHQQVQLAALVADSHKQNSEQSPQ